MHLIDGKGIARRVLDRIEQQVKALSGRKPGLAFILVGHHSASLSYVQAKKKACAQCGIHSVLIECAETISQGELLAHIDRLNRDPAIDGILIQRPLPPHLSTAEVTWKIDVAKDVDGFHPANIGQLLLGEEGAICPCTPRGIQVLLEQSEVEVEGRHVVIVGRSNIVGKPLAALLLQKKAGCNATVTVCHSGSHALPALTRSADILVAALGSPHFITREMVKEGAVVIDVGINRVEGKIVGDVDFAAVAPIASKITPVPGGVGPMTIAMLLQNTLDSYFKNKLYKQNLLH